MRHAMIGEILIPDIVKSDSLFDIVVPVWTQILYFNSHVTLILKAV